MRINRKMRRRLNRLGPWYGIRLNGPHQRRTDRLSKAKSHGFVTGTEAADVTIIRPDGSLEIFVLWMKCPDNIFAKRQYRNAWLRGYIDGASK
jgi:hypothetical protein